MEYPYTIRDLIMNSPTSTNAHLNLRTSGNPVTLKYKRWSSARLLFLAIACLVAAVVRYYGVQMTPTTLGVFSNRVGNSLREPSQHLVGNRRSEFLQNPILETSSPARRKIPS
jgi:hypothetical protein